MKLLVDIQKQAWMTAEQFRKAAPELDDHALRFYPQLGDPADIVMLAVDSLRPGLAARLPNLRLVQKLGAGVETIVGAPELPVHIRVARVRAPAMAMEMARYCLWQVLQDVHNAAFHRREQAACRWTPAAPKRVADLTAGVLGLGEIGGACARLLVSAGFTVFGWSRSPKEFEGVACRHGESGLMEILGRADYLLSVLPATAETSGLFDKTRFAAMREDAVFINVGRGTLVVEAALLAALDAGRPRHAVLDVCRAEPLPADSPLWRHPRLTITPHVSGWDFAGGFAVVAENWRRLRDGRPLLHEVDRAAGY